MSSILTNNSAMVALQTLKSINSDLAKTQSMISTGKSVATAKDNAALWSISKVMESDVKGFKAISDSLSLGQSTVAVARNASETVADLLTEIKGKIVNAQEENVDRGKLQTDIEALTAQIKSVVGAAQFNGANLVDGSRTEFNANGNEGINILASLDRDAEGGVASNNIGVDAQNLSTTAGTDIAGNAGTGAVTVATLTENGGANDATVIDTFTFLTNGGAANGAAALKASEAGVDVTNTDGLVVGDAVTLNLGNTSGTYRVREGDTVDSVLTGLKNSLQEAGVDTDAFSFDLTTTGEMTITNQTSEAGIAVSLDVSRGSGTLADLETMDVTTDAGAETALGNIEQMIGDAIDAAAAFGSVEGRVTMQSDFIGKLTDSLKSGIGALVDADMEEASARLQALQVQQQLGIQSLSIANQAPQSILSLFR